MDRLTVVTERSGVVAAICGAGVAAQIAGESLGLPVALAAAAVLAVLAVQAALLIGARRRRALELITQGRARIPLGVVERERRRLIDRAHRERLAQSIDEIREDAERLAGRERPGLLLSPRAIRAVAPELVRAATLVREEHAQVRGVAILECLLTDGGSPLYGDNAELIRQELRRAGFLLESQGRRP